MAEVRRKLEIAQRTMIQPATTILHGSPSPTKSIDGGSDDDIDNEGDGKEAGDIGGCGTSDSSRAALTQRARQRLLQGDEDSDYDDSNAYGSERLSTATTTTYNHASKPQPPGSSAENNTVPVLHTSSLGHITSAPSSARETTTRPAVASSTMISPRGGAQPTIKLVSTTTTPIKQSDGDLEQKVEESQEYVVEESSDED